MVGKVFALDFCKVLAKKYDRFIHGWNLQKGLVTITKSVDSCHIASNTDIFNFELSTAADAYLARLDYNEGTGAYLDHFDC